MVRKRRRFMPCAATLISEVRGQIQRERFAVGKLDGMGLSCCAANAGRWSTRRTQTGSAERRSSLTNGIMAVWTRGGARRRSPAAQTIRASAATDARVGSTAKKIRLDNEAYAASSPGSSFLLSSNCFSSSARFLALISSRFWRLTSSCFSAPSSSMKAFSAPSPCWKPVRTMRR